MKRLQFIFALTLTALPAMAKDNTPALITTVQQQDGITASLQSQFNEAKQLVVNAPTHFNGMELPISNTKKVTLTVVKSTPNGFGRDDEEAWINEHRSGMSYRRYWFGDMKPTEKTQKFYNMPLTLGNLWRATVEEHDGYNVFLYGEHKFPDMECGYDPYLAVVTNPEVTRIERVISFSNVRDAFKKIVMTNVSGGFSDFATPAYYGCTFEGNTMYVAISHNTYSSSSRGKNSYLAAIDITTGKIKWMTKPLTCNSQFVITGNSIICGYGFSGEKHFVYVVDKNTGRRASTVLVKKSPELFSIMGTKVYSRMYAFDYTFNMK